MYKGVKQNEQKDYKEIARIIKKFQIQFIKNGCDYDELVNDLADYFEREEKGERWILCNKCADKGIDGRIAVDKHTIFPIYCDCGNGRSPKKCICLNKNINIFY